MTGIRSCMSDSSELGVVVMIMQFDHFSLRIVHRSQSPAKREQLSVANLKTIGLLGLAVPLPLIETVRRNQTPSRCRASRNAGLTATVSDLALIIPAPIDGSPAQEGIEPPAIHAGDSHFPMTSRL